MRRAWAVGAWVLAVASCHLAGGVDDVTFVEELECREAAECNGATECQMASCEDAECRFDDAPEGTPCSLGWCDGDGECVECTRHEDCASGRCDEDACVPQTCDNGVRDEDETDVDCGGEDCLPCASGAACEDDDDCVGGNCDEELCEACSEDDDCGDDAYCDDAVGECAGRKPIGAVCSDDRECLDGLDCADDVCEG